MMLRIPFQCAALSSSSRSDLAVLGLPFFRTIQIFIGALTREIDERSNRNCREHALYDALTHVKQKVGNTEMQSAARTNAADI